MNLTHIRLFVDDLEACSGFYRDGLGLPRMEKGGGEPERAPSGDSVELQAGAGVRLELVHREAGAPAQPATGATAPDRAALCFEVDDLQATVAHLCKRGINLAGEAEADPSLKASAVSGRDPEGNPVRLYARPRAAAAATPVQHPAVVSLREVTAETVRDICRLSDTLPEVHRRMVAPNAVSIAQAHFEPHAWFRAIYAGDAPAGFIMLYIGPDEDRPGETEYFLWRLMVAASYQGLGVGRQALEAVMADLRTQGATYLRTSCGQGEGSPEGFYRRLGFERTGEMEGDEVELMIKFVV